MKKEIYTVLMGIIMMSNGTSWHCLNSATPIVEYKESDNCSIERFNARRIKHSNVVENQDFYGFNILDTSKVSNYDCNVIYDFNSEENGFVIDFDYDNGVGYAIYKGKGDENSLMEFSVSQHSPYYGYEGKYLYNNVGQYYLASNDGSLENLLLKSNGLGDKQEEYVKKEFQYKTGFVKDEYEISDFYTAYSSSMVDDLNNCANTAGVIVLNYWNKQHSNKILNLTKTNRWNMLDDDAKYYMHEFYNYMKTNKILGTYGGTLPKDCHDGFEKFISDHGFETEKTMLTSYADIKRQIDLGIPIFITSDQYYFTNEYSRPPDPISQYGTHTMAVNYNHYWGISNSHTFVGYGYLEQEFISMNNEKFNMNFIKVATGNGNDCYFNLSMSMAFDVAAIKVSKC